MTGVFSEMSEKSCTIGEKNVPSAESVAIEMQSIVRDAAKPLLPGDTIGRQIERAARVLGMATGKCKRLWYREDKAILAHEADGLRAWHAQWQERQIRRLDHELNLLKACKAKWDKC
ncbi:hypothetical protein [Komagataeibacter medellinensis]|uniref:hypothetical protein n=1 Tax=Komagataeibacter medellinensis TaxID=1177712 RepID=UPI0018864501|nr:hypothetical protein [Komagataeibacter medellinensis]